jgi:hypothetical protein
MAILIKICVRHALSHLYLQEFILLQQRSPHNRSSLASALFCVCRKQNGRDKTTRQESSHICDADEVKTLIDGLNFTQPQSLI